MSSGQIATSLRKKVVVLGLAQSLKESKRGSSAESRISASLATQVPFCVLIFEEKNKVWNAKVVKEGS